MKKTIRMLILIIVLGLFALALFGLYKWKYAPRNQPNEPEVEDLAAFENLCNSNGGVWAKNLPGRIPQCVFAGIQYLNSTDLKNGIVNIVQKHKEEETTMFRNLCTSNKGIWTDESPAGIKAKCNFKGADYEILPTLNEAIKSAVAPVGKAVK